MIRYRQSRWAVLVAVMLAILPVVVDMTVLHIAVPTLTLALHASGTEVLWIIDIYPLVTAGLLVPMGTLADRNGYRRMLLTGLCVFAVASLAAAFATSAATLIAARALLGVGSSMIMPCALAVIRLTFKDEAERATALGAWSVVGMAGAAVGPLVGGVLLEHFWWGSVFLLNVPIMTLVIPLVWLLVPRATGNPCSQWSPHQAILLIAALILTVYGFKLALRDEISLVSAATLAAGIFSLGWFSRLQVSSAKPMLDLSLLTTPAIAVGLLMAFVVSGSLAGFELVLAQELQFTLNKTPLEAGIFMLPFVIASAVGGPIGAPLATRFGLRWIASLSMAASALSLAGISVLDVKNDSLVVSLFLIILGFSLGVGLLASSVAVMGSAPAEKAGAAGALESTGYELGSALGVTIFGGLVNFIYRSSYSGQNSGSARNSIGESMTAAREVGGSKGIEIANAAKVAFAGAHGTVLMLVSVAIAILSLAVFVALRGYRPAMAVDTVRPADKPQRLLPEAACSIHHAATETGPSTRIRTPLTHSKISPQREAPSMKRQAQRDFTTALYRMLPAICFIIFLCGLLLAILAVHRTDWNYENSVLFDMNLVARP